MEEERCKGRIKVGGKIAQRREEVRLGNGRSVAKMGNGQQAKWVKGRGDIIITCPKKKGKKKEEELWTRGASKGNGQKPVGNDIGNGHWAWVGGADLLKANVGRRTEKREGPKKALREGISRWTADRALHWVQRGRRGRDLLRRQIKASNYHL